MKDRRDSLVVYAGDESSEAMIKKFCKRFRGSGILQELMDRRHHMKPSAKRRLKDSRARSRRRLDEKSGRRG